MYLHIVHFCNSLMILNHTTNIKLNIADETHNFIFKSLVSFRRCCCCCCCCWARNGLTHTCWHLAYNKGPTLFVDGHVVVVVVDGHVKGLILISEILVSPFLITVFLFCFCVCVRERERGPRRFNLPHISF